MVRGIFISFNLATVNRPPPPPRKSEASIHKQAFTARSSHRSSLDRQYEFRAKGIALPSFQVCIAHESTGGYDSSSPRRLKAAPTPRTYEINSAFNPYCAHTIKSITAYHDRPPPPRVYETATFIEPRRVIRDPSSGLRKPRYFWTKFSQNVSRGIVLNFVNFRINLRFVNSNLLGTFPLLYTSFLGKWVQLVFGKNLDYYYEFRLSSWSISKC